MAQVSIIYEEVVFVVVQLMIAFCHLVVFFYVVIRCPFNLLSSCKVKTIRAGGSIFHQLLISGIYRGMHFMVVDLEA